MADAVSVLKEQHVEVDGLMMKIERVQDPTLRSQVFRTIDTNLRNHAHIEETIFYPEFKKRARNHSQSEEVDESLEEHAEVKATLEALEKTDPRDQSFVAGLQKLKRLVKHHVDEEEHGMLRQAPKIFSTRELDDMGFLMEEALRQASPVYEMSGPAPPQRS